MRLGGPLNRSECFGEEILVLVTRTAERGFGPGEKNFSGPPSQGVPTRRKVRKQNRENVTTDGRWPHVPSARQITTELRLILPRKTKTYATCFNCESLSRSPGPGNLYQLLLHLVGAACHKSNHDLSVVHPAVWWPCLPSSPCTNYSILLLKIGAYSSIRRSQ
jgi:hypothetical protein